MAKQRPSVIKRQREQVKRERQQMKIARRAARKSEGPLEPDEIVAADPE